MPIEESIYLCFKALENNQVLFTVQIITLKNIKIMLDNALLIHYND